MKEQAVDAVLLAGTHKNPKRLVRGENKAFLTLKGEPLVRITAREILRSSLINKLVVVGPRERLETALAPLLEAGARIRIVQQRNHLLENGWTGFLATFADGNQLPVNKQIDKLLLRGHLPLKNKSHLYIVKSIYAAMAGYMDERGVEALCEHEAVHVMERRINDFRDRFERREWFMGKLDIGILLREGHIIHQTDDGIRFQNIEKQEYFLEWERRLHKAIFITAADVPLIVPEVIEDFIRRCRQVDGDFYFGVSTEKTLEPFYTGENGAPGFVRPYMQLREARVRAANLILVKPNKIGNKELIQETFGIRKISKWKNVCLMIWKLIKQKHRYQTVRLALMLQAAFILEKHGRRGLANKIRLRIRVRQIETSLSHLFMTRFRFIPVPYGGVSLDIDSEEDYERLAANYDFWKTRQAELIATLDMHALEPIFNALPEDAGDRGC